MIASSVVVGREEELAAIRGLFESSRGGGLLLSGEPGIGKTLLWELGTRKAREAGWRVLQHRSAQAEAGLAFAGLSDLLGGVFDDVADALVPPRRRALEVALLLVEPGDAPPDSRALGLAMLDVIRELAAQQPVCLALDDVQWLDTSSAAVAAIAVRRLADERVAVLATRRTPPGEAGGPAPFDTRLTQLTVRPLDRPSIRRLVRTAVGRELPRATLAAIERASGGNPFFAVELARSAECDEGERHIHVPENLRELLSGRLDRLPAATQDVLLDAAALARPTVGLVAPDEVRLAALDVAVLDRIVSVHRDEVRFAHPLLASLSYDRAPPGRLRAVHARLADLVDDPEERARHLAIAAGEAHDRRLASELDEASRHAAARGAAAAAAELTELALRHTPEEDREEILVRRIAAGGLHLQAGDIDRAADLYEALLVELPAGRRRAEVLYADALTQRPDVLERIALCEEALALVSDDDVLATELLGFLAINRWLGGEVAEGLENARAALTRAERVGDPRLVATVIARVGWLELAHLDTTPGLLERGVELERQVGGQSRFQDSPLYTLASHHWMHDGLEIARSLLMELATTAERRGDEVTQGFGLAVLCSVERLAGRLELAVELHETALLLAEQTAEPQLRLVASAFGARALLEAGRLDDAWQLSEQAMALTLAVKDVTHGTIAESVLGQIEFVRGNLEAAHRRLDGIPERLLRRGALLPYEAPWSESIEALIGLGQLQRAEALLSELEAIAPRANRCARAVAARARGLLALARGDDDGAVRALELALGEEGGTYPLERGRTLIALGVTHRHARRVRAAREVLSTAIDLLAEIGATAWRDKAAAELARLSGRRAHGDELTEAERRVAQLAAEGRHNKEIASTLFLSVGTVEMHLSRVYRKLGVRSRTELAGHHFLTTDGAAGQQTN
jgi:DNA-binding CsgD family transcriptional regulator